MTDIVFILSALHSPRCIKRMIALKEAGFHVSVYGYERRLNDKNIIPPDIEVHKLGCIENGRNYIKRMFLIIKNVLRIKKDTAKDSIFYVLGFDNMFVIKLLTKNRYIYEISDLMYCTGPYASFHVLFKIIDCWLIRKSLLTVLTSEGFYKYLFKDKVLKNVIIQPNKINQLFKSIDRPCSFISDIHSLKFGFIGEIRFPNTLFRFAEVIGKQYPQHCFYFYGACSKPAYESQLNSLVLNYANIKYMGSFKNPDDLEEIYRNIDILIVCYDLSTGAYGVKFAEPNKLYEGIFFCKPIVVSTNTFLADQVKRYGCGYAIDASKNENIWNIIDRLDLEGLRKIQKHCYEIDTDECIDNPQKLVNCIKDKLS